MGGFSREPTWRIVRDHAQPDDDIQVRVVIAEATSPDFLADQPAIDEFIAGADGCFFGHIERLTQLPARSDDATVRTARHQEPGVEVERAIRNVCAVGRVQQCECI
jgi:hypothetical protein